jgi:PAS domain S-box-containing protein
MRNANDSADERWPHMVSGEGDARFRRLAEAAFEAIVIHQHGRILEVNPACADLFGYAPDELVGRSAVDLAAPPSRAIVQEHIEAGLEEPYEAIGQRSDGSRFHAELRGKAIPYEGGTARVVAIQDVTERVRLHQRHTALLRIARRFATESVPQHVLRLLAEEAAGLFTAAGAVVYRWDDDRAHLMPAGASRLAEQRWLEPVQPGHGVAGRAAAARRAVRVEDYQAEFGATTLAGQTGVQAAVGVPLIDDGRLVGVLAVGSLEPGAHFTTDEVETLGIVASMAVSQLDTLERARLAGALLAARTVQHFLANDLTLAMGYAELMAREPTLGGEVREWASEVSHSIERATAWLARLQEITALEETDEGPVGAQVLDMHRCLAPLMKRADTG